MFKIAAATAFACVIVLASDPGHARFRVRMSAPSKPVSAAAIKPVQPVAAAKASERPRSSGGGFVVVPMVRPFAAAPRPAGAAAADMSEHSTMRHSVLDQPDTAKLASAEASPEPETAHAPPPVQAGLVALSMNYRVKPEPSAQPAVPHRSAAVHRPVVCYVQASGACVAR